MKSVRKTETVGGLNFLMHEYPTVDALVWAIVTRDVTR